MWTNGNRTHVTTATRKRILARDRHQCVQCGSTERLEVDHILNVARGGTHDLDNLQTLCADCHATKTAKESGEWRRKTKRQPRRPIGLT